MIFINMKLMNLLFESKDKQDTFETFADTREAGAGKIADTAHKKGGLALLTWHHFKVKLPYYKKAAAGKFDQTKAKAELKVLTSELAQLLKTFEPKDQIPFQKIMGKIEVVGELIIRSTQNQ